MTQDPLEDIQDSPRWTPGSAPKSTSGPDSWRYPVRPPQKDPVRPSEPRGATGWVCPSCGVGVAPWMPYCGHCEPKETKPRQRLDQCEKCKGTGYLVVVQPALASGIGTMSTYQPCPNGCPKPHLIQTNVQPMTWNKDPENDPENGQWDPNQKDPQ